MKHYYLKALALLSCLLLGITAHALGFEAQNNDGATIYYYITTDKTVSVTYQGSYYYSYGNEYYDEITIPSIVTYNGTTYSVTSIGDYAFRGCTGLTSIIIPNSVISIGGYAFCGCSDLTSITIPNSVTSIGDYAFINCTGLTTIVVDSGNTKYHSRNNCNAIIEAATSTLILGCKNTIIPNRVLSIRDKAFMGCSGLTSITIPNSVTSIGNYVFSGCTSLKELRIEDGESTLSLGYNRYDSAKDGGLFSDCPLETLYLGRNLEHDGIYQAGHYSPFYDKDLLKSVIIGNSVTNFGANTFKDCNSLTDVIIGESVKFIGYDAFYGCSGLTSVTIPNSVTSIGDDAFSDCI